MAETQLIDDRQLKDMPEPQRLASAIEAADKRMDIFRKQRTMFMRHFAGPYYGQQDLESAESPWRQPLNLIFSLGSTLEPTLAMRLLRTGVATHDQTLRAFATRLELGIDRVLFKARAPKAIRVCIRDALNSMGVLKTYQEKAGSPPTCKAVSLDDYFIDHRARSREPDAYAFEGHRFRFSYDDLMDSDLLTKAGRHIIANEAKDQWENESKRAEKLSQGGPHIGETAFRRQIELVEAYLPYRQSLVWLPGSLHIQGKEYLREFKFYGPEVGPFDLLGFHWLNDNAIAVGIMGIIFDLYLLENRIANKIARQAETQKDIGLIDATSDKDAEAIRNAQDGQYVNAPGAKGQVLSFGGANDKGYQSGGWFADWFNRIARNPELVGGMAAGSKTLGQDEMLMANANVGLDDMRGYVLEMAQSVADKFGWYLWHDPALDMKLSQDLGKGLTLPVRWRPQYRMGELQDYDISVTVAGRHSDTPEQKSARMAQWFQTYVMPVAALAAQQGSRLNVDLLVNMAGQYMDIDEIEDLWEEGEPIESPAATPALGTHNPSKGPTAPRSAAGRIPQRPVEAMAVPTGAP